MEEQLLQAKEELLQAKEELLEAKAQITALRRARARERSLHKRHQAEFPVLESKLQSAASVSPRALAPDFAYLPPDSYYRLPHGSLGRYADGIKHVCYKGFIYASAHVHDVEIFPPEDGPDPVDIDAGFEIAPGDAADVEVTMMYPWQCSHLVFRDGALAYTDMYPDTDFGDYEKGVKSGRGNLIRDVAGRVSTNTADGDVLLRKRI